MSTPNSRLGDAAVIASNVAYCQTQALKISLKAQEEVCQLRGTSGRAQERLITLLESTPTKKERKALAKIIATQLFEGKVDTGDLASTFTDIMKEAGVTIYPPPWEHAKWRKQ